MLALRNITSSATQTKLLNMSVNAFKKYICTLVRSSELATKTRKQALDYLKIKNKDTDKTIDKKLNLSVEVMLLLNNKCRIRCLKQPDS